MENLFRRIGLNPIIAAVNNIADFSLAVNSACEVIFLLTGSIFNIKDLVEKAKHAGKGVCIHLDLMEGFSKDLTALQYIDEHIKPDGVISTKGNLARKARVMPMFFIQRLLILDTLSLESGIRSIRETKPDAIEILPGIMPRIIKKIGAETRIPLIAGGLIEDRESVEECLRAGAVGVSSSNKSLWNLRMHHRGK